MGVIFERARAWSLEEARTERFDLPREPLHLACCICCSLCRRHGLRTSLRGESQGLGWRRGSVGTLAAAGV